MNITRLSLFFSNFTEISQNQFSALNDNCGCRYGTYIDYVVLTNACFMHKRVCIHTNNSNIYFRIRPTLLSSYFDVNTYNLFLNFYY